MAWPKQETPASPMAGRQLNGSGEKRSTRAGGRRSLLLLFQLFEVEVELLALKNVTIEAAGLAGAG